MAKVLQHRRDTTTNLSTETGAIGEFFMDTTKNTLVVMDGSTNGGHPLALESDLVSNLGDLSNVTLTTPSNGQVLKYNGSIWVNSSDAGIGLSDLSVTTNSAGSAALSYNNSTGAFTYTPPDLSSYQTTSGLNSAIDSHLNQSNPTSGYVLSWNGSDYAWVAQSGGSGANLSAVAEDILPSLDGIYDLGSSTNQWYDLFVSNSVAIGGSSLTGNSTGLVTDTMLIGDLLVTTNTITPDASTALQYNGDQGVVDIIGNLDVSAGDWLLPAVVDNFSETTTVTANDVGLTSVSFEYSGNSAVKRFYFGSQNFRTIFIDNFLKAGAQITFNFSYPGGDWIFNLASDFDADSDLSFDDTGNVGYQYGVIVTNSKGSWDTAPGNEAAETIYTMTYTTSATYTTSSGVPLTTGTEGAIRYNKIESALQLYTDSWNNVVPLNTDNALVYNDMYDSNGYGAYQLSSTLTLEAGKRYVLTSTAGVTAYLPDNPTVGDSIEIRWRSMNSLTVTNPASGWSSLTIGNNAYLYTFIYLGTQDSAGAVQMWEWTHTGGSSGTINKF